MRILIIEDDTRLSALMRQELTEELHAVDVAHDGETGLELALRDAHDLIIVDWMLPLRDGPSVCRAVRAARLTMPILMLTARAQVRDRVAGLDSGADDYLSKPFAFDELHARVRALSRRSSGSNDAGTLTSGDIAMNLRAHTAACAGEALELTLTEWNLLECFIRHAGQTLSRDQILDCVWSYDANVLPTMVDTYVSYLRRKLSASGKSDPIQTVRGVGYRLLTPEARDT